MRARPAGHFIAWVDDMRCKGVECMRLLALVTAFTIRSAEGRAGDVVSQAAHEMPGRSSGPYCGLYSAGRLASLLNSPQPIDLPKYACARYVKSREGSTPTQIAAILAENDIAVNGFARLSAVDLLTTNVPWIANVRRFPESTAFDHWVCVHVASDGVVVYDGAGAGQRQSLGEFLAIWNGYALVPSHERSIAVLLTSRIVLFLLAASAIATGVQWSLRRGWPLHRRIVLLACLAGVASYAGAADHCITVYRHALRRFRGVVGHSKWWRWMKYSTSQNLTFSSLMHDIRRISVEELYPERSTFRLTLALTG